MMVCVAMQCILWTKGCRESVDKLFGWLKMYLKFDEIVPIILILCKKMITTNEKECLTPQSCCYVPEAAVIAP